MFINLFLVYESYDMCLDTKSSTNYGLCYYDHANKIKFGFTSKFVQINHIIYAFIIKAEKKRSFINEEVIEYQLGKFFLIGQLTNKIELITISNIINKCSILKNTECNEILFSRSTELNEHD